MTIFETERLLLRRLLPTDLDSLAALYADPDIRRYFPEGTLTRAETQEELDWFLAGVNPDYPDLGLWATIHKPSGAFIGRCGLLVWEIEGATEIEIAYLIAKSHWGEGLGKEAALGLVRHGFGELGLTRLIALVHPDNTASIHTAEAAGLVFEKTLSLPGETCSIYAITR